jgi:hypothetical protein
MTMRRMLVLMAMVMLAAACGDDVEEQPGEGEAPSAAEGGPGPAVLDSAQSDNTSPNGAHTGG